MVMILNGEIVNDNDPRVRQRSLSFNNGNNNNIPNNGYHLNNSHLNVPHSNHSTPNISPQVLPSSPNSYYYNSNNNTHHNNYLNTPSFNNGGGYSLNGSTSPYLSPYNNGNIHQSSYYNNQSSQPPPFALSQSSDYHSNVNPSSRSIYQSSASSTPQSSSLASSSSSSPFTSPTLNNNNNVPRASSNYSLFGLPPIFIYDFCIPPHLYLPTILLLYLIGPPSLLAILPAFMFYRWHLLREAEKAARERTLEKFLPFKDAKTRNRMNSSTIHTITDWQQSSSSPMSM